MEWLHSVKPDVLCLQEIKCHPTDLPSDTRQPDEYLSIWNPAARKGYSGTAMFFRKDKEPIQVSTLGVDEFDCEGRVQIVEYKNYYLINAYYPNSQPERKRLHFKLAFNEALKQKALDCLITNKHVIICGDFNVAHTEIDLARPEENRNNPGFYPEECESFDAFLRSGFTDVFRRFHPGEPGHYTWWSYRTRARERNVGWRLDYHCVDNAFFRQVKEVKIWTDVYGSDHCPISIVI